MLVICFKQYMKLFSKAIHLSVAQWQSSCFAAEGSKISLPGIETLDCC